MLDFRMLIGIILTIVISLYIVIARPEMHKQAIITDSTYDFAEITIPSTEIKPELVPVSVSTTPSKNQEIKTSTQNGKPAGIKTSGQSAKQTRDSGSKKQSPSAVQTQNKQKETPKNTVKTQEQTTPKQQTQVNIPQPKQIKMTRENPVENKSKPILTEQEEIIAWNKWRSQLQNQVMKDTKLSAPLGTQFKFSFTVDKFGNLSNVKVWSTTPAYSDMAVRAIKPVLMSYRNQPILNFPDGTKRVITNVTGGFVISHKTEYSSPSDYHDFERVRR